MKRFSPFAVLFALFAFSAAGQPAPAPTVYKRQAFLRNAEQRMLQLSVESGRADWVKINFITEDTEILAAKADERTINAGVELAKQSVRFDRLALPPELARKMKVLTTSRNYDELLDAWTGWHSISRPMRKDFVTYVAVANKGAKELGFADTGAMWRSKYDMPPDAFAEELDRIWEQVKPLYLSLHAYVRTKLREKYGDRVPANGPIPAHLLGNMWAQEWGNIYPLVAPAGADPGYDLTQILKSRKTNDQQMVKYGEGFFTSLGFAPLPETFWKRSLFVKPRDRDVVCHASAWDVDAENDLRIKMCIDITAEDFNTIHHELGHNFYQ